MQDLFHASDIDGSGQIDYEEFIAAMLDSNRVARRKEAVRKSFEELDRVRGSGLGWGLRGCNRSGCGFAHSTDGVRMQLRRHSVQLRGHTRMVWVTVAVRAV